VFLEKCNPSFLWIVGGERRRGRERQHKAAGNRNQLANEKMHDVQCSNISRPIPINARVTAALILKWGMQATDEVRGMADRDWRSRSCGRRILFRTRSIESMSSLITRSIDATIRGLRCGSTTATTDVAIR
jgi:hypothetical protein